MRCHRLIKGQSNKTNLYRIPPLMHSWYHETHLPWQKPENQSGGESQMIVFVQRESTYMNPNLTFTVTIFFKYQPNMHQKNSKQEVSFCQSYFTRKVFNIQKYVLCRNRRSLSLRLPVLLLLLLLALSLSLSQLEPEKRVLKFGDSVPFSFCVCVCVLGEMGPLMTCHML